MSNDLRKIPRKILTALLILTLLVLGTVTAVHWNKNKESKTNSLSMNSWQNLACEVEKCISKFPGEVGVVIKDLSTGYVVRYNADVLFPSASLVKIPIMAAVFQKISENQTPIDSQVVLQKMDRVSGTGQLKYYSPGKKFTILQLLDYMITRSDNTATQMLTRYLGFDYINSVFRLFGLTNTNMVRGIMDLKSRNKGIENYTTANDMAYILEKIYKNEIANKEISDQMMMLLKKQRINDRLNRGLPSGWIVAHKTGLMRSVCHDVGIVFHHRGDFIICVLTNKVNNYRKTKQFIGEIAKIVFNYYDNGFSIPATIINKNIDDYNTTNSGGKHS